MGNKSLIISTFPKDDLLVSSTVNKFKSDVQDLKVIYTDALKINNCVGCTNCWLKTPGVCAIKDDYIEVFKSFLKADSIIFITEMKNGFISYKMKNMIDRIIPLVVPYTKIYNGAMRHISRYNKKWNVGLIYIGECDKKFINKWMMRFTLNFYSRSLGAYGINESEVLIREINNI